MWFIQSFMRGAVFTVGLWGCAVLSLGVIIAWTKNGPSSILNLSVPQNSWIHARPMLVRSQICCLNQVSGVWQQGYCGAACFLAEVSRAAAASVKSLHSQTLCCALCKQTFRLHKSQKAQKSPTHEEPSVFWPAAGGSVQENGVLQLLQLANVRLNYQLLNS